MEASRLRPTKAAKRCVSLLGAHSAALLETFAAKDGPALRGAEGHGGFLAALRTAGLGFRAYGRGSAASATFGALGLAGLAALGLILKTFIGEEHLLSAGKDKLGATLRTLQDPIVVFHCRYPPDRTSITGRGLCTGSQRGWVYQ